jgi:hypothetical protein
VFGIKTGHVLHTMLSWMAKTSTRPIMLQTTPDVTCYMRLWLLNFGFLLFVYSISVTNILTDLTWSCLFCFSVFPLLGCKESFVTNQRPNLSSITLHDFTIQVLWSDATHTYLFYKELYPHDIQVYLKFLNKFQEWVLYIKTKQISYKHMFGNVWFLILIERIYSTINTLPMLYSTYRWSNAFTVHIPNLITVQFILFIKSKFTTNAQNVLSLKQCPWILCLWTVALFLRSCGICKRFDRL